jgi:hypothetical protein
MSKIQKVYKIRKLFLVLNFSIGLKMPTKHHNLLQSFKRIKFIINFLFHFFGETLSYSNKNIYQKYTLQKKLFLIILISIFQLINYPSHAKEINSNLISSKTQNLKIGVLIQPPFVIERNGYYVGLAFELWENIANMNHFNCEYINVGTNKNLAVKRLANGEYDVLIGEIGVFYKRTKLGEYTLPFYKAKYILISQESNKKLKDIWINLYKLITGFSKITPIIIIGLYLLFIVIFSAIPAKIYFCTYILFY